MQLWSKTYIFSLLALNKYCKLTYLHRLSFFSKKQNESNGVNPTRSYADSTSNKTYTGHIVCERTHSYATQHIHRNVYRSNYLKLALCLAAIQI